MSPGSRPERIADQVRAALGELLTREVKDPGIGFVTVTRVHVTPDLQLARVYYTSLGDAAARRNTTRALGRAAPFLRRQIGHRLRVKRTPELQFVFDESIERQDRIERLLQEIRDAGPAASGGPHDDRQASDHDDDPDR